jgi:hypothetical protein
MATINVLDSTGATVAVQLPNANGLPFAAVATVNLTSTTTSQPVVFAAGVSTNQIVVINGCPNIVYIKLAGTVTIPGATPDVTGIIACSPNSTQPFTLPMNGGTLAFIAATAGGPLTIMTGNGI